jgi:hypothetical protein
VSNGLSPWPAMPLVQVTRACMWRQRRLPSQALHLTFSASVPANQHL